MDAEDLFGCGSYSLDASQKEQALLGILKKRLAQHAQGCHEYAAILKALKNDGQQARSLEELPFIPVRLFKQYELLSVPREEIVKTLTSSGTSGQARSKIFLNASNVRSQTRALNAIIGSFIGGKRLPLLLLDTALVRRDRAMYSARGAGIIGFSLFGRDTVFALDAQMRPDWEAIEAFFERHRGERVLMFGYTFMIWKFMVKALEAAGRRFDFSDAVLFHIGGWKKLKDEAVSSEEFASRLRGVLGNVSVHNYYGMAEQLGSVFVECEHGHLHCPVFSDIIIRRPSDFSAAPIHERGLVELISALPESYPGNVILTEDEGEILGCDDCPCGRKGRYFRLYGRVKDAELRGCSDTYGA